MKAKINISVFLFVILTLLPTVVGAIGNCGIDTDCCEETSVPAEESSEDHCLSFCFCSCCGTPVFFDLKNEKAPQPKIFTDLSSIFIYQSPSSLQISLDIWQPPKSV